MINVQQRQVIAIDVREPHLRLVRLLLHLIGPHKTLRDFKRSKERQEKKMDAANKLHKWEWPLEFQVKKIQFMVGHSHVR